MQRKICYLATPGFFLHALVHVHVHAHVHVLACSCACAYIVCIVRTSHVRACRCLRSRSDENGVHTPSGAWEDCDSG